MVNHEIATSFGAVSPFMPEKGGTQYHANDNPKPVKMVFMATSRRKIRYGHTSVSCGRF
ncbi:hypothetical protein LEP1GSC070_1784 [Leptospira santarosai str. AIM]|nr:hypothetical protein LEP1GSC070_1784 [Leptospira santarosai str. AIM]